MNEVHDKMCYLQQLLKITWRNVVAYASDSIEGHPHHVYAFMRDRNGEMARMLHGTLLRAIADPQVEHHTTVLDLLAALANHLQVLFTTAENKCMSLALERAYRLPEQQASLKRRREDEDIDDRLKTLVYDALGILNKLMETRLRMACNKTRREDNIGRHIERTLTPQPS